MPLELPTDECGALVIRNVSALDRHEQAALLRWLEGDRKQVVATSVDPLFPLIARKRFDEALYYRLNVMLLRIDSPGALLIERRRRQRRASRPLQTRRSGG